MKVLFCRCPCRDTLAFTLDDKARKRISDRRLRPSKWAKRGGRRTMRAGLRRLKLVYVPAFLFRAKRVGIGVSRGFPYGIRISVEEIIFAGFVRKRRRVWSVEGGMRNNATSALEND